MVTRIETIHKLESDFRQRNSSNRRSEPQLRWQDSVDEFERAKGKLPDIVNEERSQAKKAASPGKLKVVDSNQFDM